MMSKEPPRVVFCPFCGGNVAKQIDEKFEDERITCKHCGEMVDEIVEVTKEDYFIKQCDICFEHNNLQARFCLFCGSNQMTRATAGVKKKKYRRKGKLEDVILNPKGLLWYLCIIPNSVAVILAIIMASINWNLELMPLFKTFIVFFSIVGAIDAFYIIVFIISFIRRRILRQE